MERLLSRCNECYLLCDFTDLLVVPFSVTVELIAAQVTATAESSLQDIFFLS